jgi:hypothetical protein
MTSFKNYSFVLIIIGCGIMAGIYDAHIQLENIVETPKDAPHIWRISILRSTIAAFTVPLFLTIISSKLIDISEGLTLQKGLVLIGFCLIAAVNADKFLDNVFNSSISSFKKEVETNNKLQKQVIKNQNNLDQVNKSLILMQKEQQKDSVIKKPKELNREFLKQFGGNDLNKNQWNIVKLLGANTNNLWLESLKNEINTTNLEKDLKDLERKNFIKRIEANTSNDALILLKEPM